MRSVGIVFGSILSGALAASIASPASATTYTVLHSFCHGNKFVCKDGKSPAAGLVSDAHGNLYGTTSAGGDTGNGVIFELEFKRKANKYAYRVLHSFDGAADGGVPITPLIIDTAGNLYGTATADGSDFGGTAFEISPNADRSAWTYKVLINFCSHGGTGCIDGMVPESGLAYAGSSTGVPYDGTSPLYGTTLEGSTPGIVYRLTQSGGSWDGSVLYGFCAQASCADGEFPVGQIAVDGAGRNVYGTTNGGGGENGSGVVFKVATANGAETVLHTFCGEVNCTDGSGAQGGVALSGKTLFGTAPLGGKNDGGVVFRINVGSEKEKVLYSFCSAAGCTDGQGPDGPPLQNSVDLFGVALGGDASVNGVIYQIGPDNSETVLHHFCQADKCTDGSLPVGGVVINSIADIFGVTERGGDRGDGVVYELAP